MQCGDIELEVNQGPNGKKQYPEITKMQNIVIEDMIWLKAVSIGWPIGTTCAAGFKVSTGQPVGTTVSDGFNVTTWRPISITLNAGFNASQGSPVLYM